MAVGGTFDHVHEGHKALLARAFESGELVYIGVTSDNYVKKAGKRVLHNFEERKAQLVEYLAVRYPFRSYIITKLDDRFGPTISEPGIEAIVVSTETFPVAGYANAKRIELGRPEMSVELVRMIMAEDGGRISSTRIRAGEIDNQGHDINKSHRSAARDLTIKRMPL